MWIYIKERGLIDAWKTFDIPNFEIRMRIHKLHCEIREAGNHLPFTTIIRERTDGIHANVLKTGNNLHLEIGKAFDHLHTTIQRDALTLAISSNGLVGLGKAGGNGKQYYGDEFHQRKFM